MLPSPSTIRVNTLVFVFLKVFEVEYGTLQRDQLRPDRRLANRNRKRSTITTIKKKRSTEREEKKYKKRSTKRQRGRSRTERRVLCRRATLRSRQDFSSTSMSSQLAPPSLTFQMMKGAPRRSNLASMLGSKYVKCWLQRREHRDLNDGEVFVMYYPINEASTSWLTLLDHHG